MPSNAFTVHLDQLLQDARELDAIHSQLRTGNPGRQFGLASLNRAAVVVVQSSGRRNAMTATSPVVHSDPDILGGTPVFTGTRVPVRNLLDYLEAGDSLREFLEDFPSVTREQAVAALELAKQMLVSHANPA
jgi:uncharacterized protein (DUF433 family)